MTSRPRDRRPELDGLRGLGAIGVASTHLTEILGGHFSDARPAGGFIGIDLFFPISGLLITSLLIKERERSGSISLRAFYHRRVRRLVPALIVFMLAHIAWVQASHRSFMHYEWTSLAWVSSQLANVGQQHHQLAPAMDISWSLAVEEQFYLVWPLLVLLALALGMDRTMLRRSVAVLIVALVAWRIGYYAANPDFTHLFISYNSTSSRAPEVLLGCWVALREPGRRGPPTWLRSLCLLGLFAVIAFAHLEDDWYYLGGMVGIALLAVIVVAPDPTPGWWGQRLLALPPLMGLGRMSYTFYLWHAMVIVIVSEHTAGMAYAPRAALCAGIALAVATAAFWLVERPVMQGRHTTTREVAPARVPVVIVAWSVVLFAAIGFAARGGAAHALLAGAGCGLVLGLQAWMGLLRPRIGKPPLVRPSRPVVEALSLSGSRPG